MNLNRDDFVNNNTNFDVTFDVTDGSMEITPVTDEVVVTIKGHKTAATYNGQEHEATGYDVEISNELYTENDFTFDGTAEAKRTDFGKTNMGLDEDQFANISKNFSNVKFDVTDGYVDIEKLAVTVKITGHKDAKTYDGEEHTVNGYDVKISDGLYSEDYFSFSGKASASRTDEGTTPMNLEKSQFENKNNNFEVTFQVEDGWMKIDAIDEVTVIITGKHDTVTYDGEEHSVTGYDVEISNELYKESNFTFSGKAEVKGTDAKTYDMGLAAEQFKNTSKNFKKVTFEVTDGYLTIDPLAVNVKVTGNHDSKVYNGKEQKVTGYETEISSKLYTENDFTFSGTDEAKGTNVDTYKMGLAAEQFADNNNSNFTVTFLSLIHI